jgi:hypothetical protein
VGGPLFQGHPRQPVARLRKGFSMPRQISDNSLYIEKTLQHLLLARLSQAIWKRKKADLLEISSAEIDNRGYDVVLSLGCCTRHVQLKSQKTSGRRRDADINMALADKPSGCVVWSEYDPESLEFTRFFFFGGAPGAALPGIGAYPVRRNPRHNAVGVRPPRNNVRLVPKKDFEKVDSVETLVEKLFG